MGHSRLLVVAASAAIPPLSPLLPLFRLVTFRVDGILEVLANDPLPAVIPDRFALSSVPVYYSENRVGNHGDIICFNGTATTPVVVFIQYTNVILMTPVAVVKLRDLPSSIDDSREKHICEALSAERNISTTATCFERLTDRRPGGRVLLEAERRYGPVLVQSSVDKLSVFCGWHSSLSNRHYHYTLRGYDRVGWMVITLEMEAGKRGWVYRYGHDDWQWWMARALAQGQGTLGAKYIFHAGDHVEYSRPDFMLYKLMYDTSRRILGLVKSPLLLNGQAWASFNDIVHLEINDRMEVISPGDPGGTSRVPYRICDAPC
ncbi:hypothetical protein EDD18DRAFT_1416590 [Armillaria luteobubalina]|uniref:Uncharacterized protein n=1 Tax=Armillaria luteobubalina TaxID=153913 RepID=A0AA39UHX2_9AGAR|nr:hypothetical protein EDD18DRAFT_1416590 [Armillaria luteobubalina]